MRHTFLALSVLALISVPAYAAVLTPITDAALIERSNAIVTGTVTSATPFSDERGMISTRYILAVDETIKGSARTEVELVELGGSVNGRFVLVPGSATYTVGERVMAYLRARDKDTFYTANMAFGRLRFEARATGAELVRDEICTLDEHQHQLEPLVAGPYVAWVRDRVSGAKTPMPRTLTAMSRQLLPQADANTASQFCVVVTDQANVTKPARWQGCDGVCPTIDVRYNGLQDAVDVHQAVTKAAAAWTNEPNANIKLANGGTTPVNDIFPNPDSVNAVVFSSSEANIPNGWCDAGSGCAIIYGNNTHTFNGESFHSIVEMDVLVRPEASGQTRVESILTHEFGHGIGLKHAESWPAPPTPSNSSIMASQFNAGNGPTLQDRDRHAASVVYGNGMCFAPLITSNSNGRTVISGETVQLSVVANGTDLIYQWYEGSSGSTATPIANTATFTTPAVNATRSFWVRVTNACGQADTSTITLTVCIPPAITTQPVSQTIGSYTSATLTVAATGSGPLAYEWFKGAAGDASQQAGSQASFTTPLLTETASYWVRVRNNCGSVNSTTATIAIGQGCPLPSLAGPAGLTSSPGKTATLSVVASGQGPFTYQWYEGIAPDNTRAITGATNSQLPLGPFQNLGTLHYWVRVTGACGTTNSSTAAVLIACAVPAPPKIAAPMAAEATIGYRVSWSETVERSFELQESSDESFSNASTILVTNALNHRIAERPAMTQDTAFYYRVRAIAACDANLKSDWSGIVKVVHRAVRMNDPNFAGTSGMSANMIREYFIPGFGSSGKTAMADSYSVTVDQDSWLFVEPASGTLPPNGVTVQIKVIGSAMSEGTTMGTITVNRTQGAGKNGFATTPPISVPVSVSLVTPVSPQPRTAGGSNDALVVPAVAHAPGALNSQFQSDIRITNTSLTPITYQVAWTPTRTNGTERGLSTFLTIGAGDTRALNDVVRDWFGSGFFGESALGALEIRPQSTPPGSPGITRTTVAASRTYNVAPKGTFGQFIPAIPLASFIGSIAKDPEAKISLQQIASSASFRTNLGFTEGAGEAAQVIARLYDNNGTLVRETGFEMPPFGHRQDNLASFFDLGSTVVNDGRVEVRVVSATGKVSAYASVLDNKTSDPLLVFPVQPAQQAAARFVVPGVAELVRADANFHTDMRIFNGGTTPVALTLTYNPQPGSPAAGGAKTITVGPNQIHAIDNVLPTLWNLTGGGAVTVSAANAAPVVVTARTYSRQEDGGTFGQFIPAVNAAQAVGATERALEVVQLEESTAFRSNLGLVEVTGNPVEIEIAAYRPESKVAARVTRVLQGNEFVQLNRIFNAMGFGNTYNGRISVRVIGGNGRVSAYGSVIDNRTLDPTYIPAQ